MRKLVEEEEEKQDTNVEAGGRKEDLLEYFEGDIGTYQTKAHTNTKTEEIE